MSEARKLDNSGLPDIPVDGARPSQDRNAGPTFGDRGDDLPPLPDDVVAADGKASGPSRAPLAGTNDKKTNKISGKDAPVWGEAQAASVGPERARPHATTKKSKGGWGRALLILFLIGFVSFAGGAGLTAGIVLGNIDTKSGKLKDTIQSAKVFIQQLRN